METLTKGQFIGFQILLGAEYSNDIGFIEEAKSLVKKEKIAEALIIHIHKEAEKAHKIFKSQDINELLAKFESLKSELT